MMAINVQLTNSGITLDIAQKHVSNTRPCPVKDFLVGWTNNLESQRRTVYKKGCAFITSSPYMVKWNLFSCRIFSYPPANEFTSPYVHNDILSMTIVHSWARDKRASVRRNNVPLSTLGQNRSTGRSTLDQRLALWAQCSSAGTYLTPQMTEQAPHV